MAFRKRLYRSTYSSLDELQADVDAWIREYESSAAALRQVLVWQNTYADIPGYKAPVRMKSSWTAYRRDFTRRFFSARCARGCGIAICQTSLNFTTARMTAGLQIAIVFGPLPFCLFLASLQRALAWLGQGMVIQRLEVTMPVLHSDHRRSIPNAG
jgi:hypothetical protein